MNKVLLYSVIIIFTSCTKDLDFGTLDKTDSNWNQEYYIPIGYSDLIFQNFKENTSSQVVFTDTINFDNGTSFENIEFALRLYNLSSINIRC